jgi:hypothetical protein
MPTFLVKDRATLIALRDYDERFRRGRVPMEFARILDIAKTPAVRAEFASAMKRLVVLGLVERRQRQDVPKIAGIPRSRASYEYRIAAAGVEKLSDGVAGSK